MRFLFDGALAQKFPHILLRRPARDRVGRETPLRVFPLPLPFGEWRCRRRLILFHQRLSRRPMVFCRTGGSAPRSRKFLFPALRMTLLRFGHAQQNASALFVSLAGGEIAIGLRRLDFGAPVAPHKFYASSGSWLVLLDSLGISVVFFRDCRRNRRRPSALSVAR